MITYRLRILFFLIMGIIFYPQIAHAQVFQPTHFTLDNGLEVVVVENHRAPVVHHMVVYRVGARDEPVGKSGLAHFMEHLMFKGTDKIPTGEFSKIIRSIGGQDNAFTTQDYTAYFQSVAREHLPLVMEMEADRMTNLTLTDDIVAVEQEVILKERGQRTDNNPVGAFWEDVNNILYPNHPYGVPIIGWGHEIAQLTRDDIENFYQTWYAPNNAIVIISGAVTPREAKNLAREYYAPIAEKTLPKRHETTVPRLTGQRQIIKQSDKIQQPLWSRHYIAPSLHVEETLTSDALLFFTEIFGGGATGRFYQDLVVKQKIATNAFVSYNPQFIGPARLSLIVTPADGVTMDQIETAVDHAIKTFFETGISKQEVHDTAQSLKTQAIYAQDNLSAPARIIGGALGSHLSIETVENWPKRLETVRAKDVINAAHDVLIAPYNKPVTGVMLPMIRGE